MAVATPPANTSNAEIVRWAFEMINAHDVPALAQLWNDATVERFPPGTSQGKAEMVRYFEVLFAAVPDAHMDVIAVAENGDDVFIHWRLTGTHSGAPFEGIDASGRAVAIDGMDHFVIRDGIVATNFVVYDQMQFARQIGMLPPDGSPADRATKAAFNAKTRLLSRLRSRRRT